MHISIIQPDHGVCPLPTNTATADHPVLRPLLITGHGLTGHWLPPPHLDIVDEELPETIWHRVSCLLVCPIPNIWHEVLTFELSSNPVVDTLGSSPVCLGI
jgi:hypothetical protein